MDPSTALSSSSADEATPSTPKHVPLFFSPLRPALTPETLRTTLSDAKLKFWTREKKALTPRTAKQISNSSGRKVMAVIKSRIATKSTGGEKEAKKAKTSMLEVLAEVQKKEETSTRSMLETLLLKVKDNEAEKELYFPLGLTRRHAVLNLQSTFLNFLNHFFLRVLQKRGDFNMWIGEGRPFPTKKAISYFKSWWYFHNELHHDAEKPLADFWAEKINYKGKSSIDNKKWRIVGTVESRRLAEALSAVMEEAEEAAIRHIGSEKGITSHNLRTVMGFFISLSRANRNTGIHFLENLFAIQGDDSPKIQTYQRENPFSRVQEDFSVNKESCAQGILILEDITATIDKLEEPDLVKAVVEWFAAWLLLQCKQSSAPEVDGMEEEVHWVWNQDFRRSIWHYPERGMYRDEESNTWWICEENKWWYHDGKEWKQVLP